MTPSAPTRRRCLRLAALALTPSPRTLSTECVRQVLRVSGAGTDKVNGDYKLHPDGDKDGKPRYLHSSGNGIYCTFAASVPCLSPSL